MSEFHEGQQVRRHEHLGPDLGVGVIKGRRMIGPTLWLTVRWPNKRYTWQHRPHQLVPVAPERSGPEPGPIQLITANGTLALGRAPADAPPCSACGGPAQVVMDVTAQLLEPEHGDDVRPWEPQAPAEARIPMCGTCLCQAAAIYVGEQLERAFRDAGGEVPE